MTDEAKARTKGGKPRKYLSEAKRPTLTFRVRGGLYEKLKTGSEARELSISEEIERRLEHSFRTDLENVEDPALAAFVRVVAMTLNVTKATVAEVDQNAAYAAALKTLIAVWFTREMPKELAPETITWGERTGAMSALMAGLNFIEKEHVPEYEAAMARLARREDDIDARQAEIDARHPDLATMSAEEFEAKRVRDLDVLRSLVPRYRTMTDDEVEADRRAEAEA